MPFWPPSVLYAAGVTAHAWPEIERMLPAFERYELVPREQAILLREVEWLFGELRFDIGVYAEHLGECAQAAGWTRVNAASSS